MKDVKNFEDFYYVTEEGFVYSKRFKKPLKPFADRNGYLYVDLFNGVDKKETSCSS